MEWIGNYGAPNVDNWYNKILFDIFKTAAYHYKHNCHITDKLIILWYYRSTWKSAVRPQMHSTFLSTNESHISVRSLLIQYYSLRVSKWPQNNGVITMSKP